MHERRKSNCTIKLFGIMTDDYRFMKLLRCREGGISKWVSSIAIHNELLRRGRKVSKSEPFIRCAELHCTICIGHRLVNIDGGQCLTPSRHHTTCYQSGICKQEPCHLPLQDLVEELAKPWNVPRKLNQQTYERDAEGQLIKEPTIPFEYHDGYLSVYYQSNNYQASLPLPSNTAAACILCRCRAFVACTAIR